MTIRSSWRSNMGGALRPPRRRVREGAGDLVCRARLTTAARDREQAVLLVRAAHRAAEGQATLTALVDGFLCPPCSEALDATGAVGVRARARAFEQHVRDNRTPAEANRVRSMLDSYDQINLPGWAALGMSSPNPEPWCHIVVPPPPENAP